MCLHTIVYYPQQGTIPLLLFLVANMSHGKEGYPSSSLSLVYLEQFGA